MATRETEDETWLVAHDFSSCAETAANLALDDLLARRSGGRLLLAHVFTVYAPPSAIDIGGATAFPQLESAARVEATRALERVAERLRARVKSASNLSGPVEIEVLARLGTPAEGLLEEADARNVQRIYIGTHGRVGVSHLLLGSVAERVVRRAKVPVVVAHEKERP